MSATDRKEAGAAMTGGRFLEGSRAYGGVCRDVQPYEQADD